MRNILFISFWVPPVVRPQAILVGKMLPHWKENGLSPFVASYSEESTVMGEFPNFRIPKIKGGIRTLKGRVARKFQLFIQFRRLVHFCAANNIEAIFSFANPQECNVLGAMVAQKLKIPFISHFSDPYSNNPYKIYNGSTQNFIKKEESFIVTSSTKVIVTNDEALKLISSNYPSLKNKFAIIPHCFEETLYPIKFNPSSVFTVSHIGAFYPQRSPEIFFEMLKNLERDNSIKKIKVKFVGGLNEYAGFSKNTMDELISKYGINSEIEIIPPVSFHDSLKFMKESDCLLMIDADIPNSPFLPSKLIDYLGAKKPILAFTPKNSPTELLLGTIDNPSFPYSEVKKSEKFMIKIMNKGVEISSSAINKYSATQTQKNLTDIIKSTLSKS